MTTALRIEDIDTAYENFPGDLYVQKREMTMNPARQFLQKRQKNTGANCSDGLDYYYHSTLEPFIKC